MIKPIEEYRMDEQETEQATSKALIKFLMIAEGSKQPTVTFVVGQPGAGKTGLAAYSARDIQKNDPNHNLPVNLNADIVAKYHKYYDELLNYPPEDRFDITREFVNPAIKEIQNKLLDKNVSMIMECTLNSEKKLEFMKKLKNRGYKVNINVMVVNEYESRISCLEREAKMLEFGETPRGIDKESQDKTYKNMVKTLGKALNNGYWDNIELFKRGDETEVPEKIYKAKRDDSNGLITKILEERNLQEDEIFKDQTKYYKRLSRVKNVFENYFMDDNAKCNAMGRLNELKKDFKMRALLREDEKKNKWPELE